MATKNDKRSVEILLAHAEMTGLPEKALPLSRNLVTVELIWPKVGTARKSASREVRFKKGVVDFAAEEWAKRCLFREEIDGHCGVAVSVSEPVSVQKLKRWAKLTAKAIMKEGADVVSSMLVSYGDVAAAPIDALATMVGEKDAPQAIAQGIVDYDKLPAPGETQLLTIPLKRPLTDAEIGMITVEVRG